MRELAHVQGPLAFDDPWLAAATSERTVVLLHMEACMRACRNRDSGQKPDSPGVRTMSAADVSPRLAPLPRCSPEGVIDALAVVSSTPACLLRHCGCHGPAGAAHAAVLLQVAGRDRRRPRGWAAGAGPQCIALASSWLAAGDGAPVLMHGQLAVQGLMLLATFGLPGGGSGADPPCHAEHGRLRTWRFDGSQGRPRRRSRGARGRAGQDQPASASAALAPAYTRPPRCKGAPEAVLAARKALLASLVAAEAAATAEGDAAAAAVAGAAAGDPGAGGQPADAEDRDGSPLQLRCDKWDAWGEDLDGLPAPSHF